ncbi:MAG: imidazolonepropionase [Pirellulaceae bacterium]|nr:MAG: imidazolonepropionase [Pirellulaceae bacterium]
MLSDNAMSVIKQFRCFLRALLVRPWHAVTVCESFLVVRRTRGKSWQRAIQWLAVLMGLGVACGFSALQAAHPEIPGAPQRGPIALIGATVHPVSGPPIENGVVLFDSGKIVQVGSDVEIPPEAERIELPNRHIYPGLFDAYSQLGLVEIDAIRATRDTTETGALNPNVRAQVAVNPDSELIPVTRSNGVLLGLVAPTGGRISGQSAVMQWDGWTYEEMTLKAPAGLHIDWPRVPPVLGRDTATATNPLAELEELFRRAKAYRDARRAGWPLVDARLEALLPVLEGSVPIMVMADDGQQIQSAVGFRDRHQLRMVLFGGYDAPLCAELLRERNIPVVVTGIYRLPLRRDDPYDAPYTLPERLRRAGLRFCIAGVERFGASNVRNLPYHAATAAAYGLPRDEALRAITLYPAQIFEVADRVGSLEPGKDATLIVTTGDVLETPTHVVLAFIQGRRVELNDRHKRLYRKYRAKYEEQP